jgi:sugar O-acyltransferase (sialic acid O-acetyltransferase NeuD family)
VELLVYNTGRKRFQFWICPQAGAVKYFGARVTDPLQSLGDNPLLFYGAGGHARVAIEAARAAGMSPALVLDDQPKTGEVAGVRVVSAAQVAWDQLRKFQFIVAIGDNAVRSEKFAELKKRGGVPATIIHPFSCISPSACIGAGTVVFGGVVVNANADIGENCILNTSCSVDHDGNISAHAHLCPGVRLAGNVTIGERTMLGTGAVCIPGIRIGADVKIGAGSVVIRDLPDECLAFGNPARPRKRFGA